MPPTTRAGAKRALREISEASPPTAAVQTESATAATASPSIKASAAAVRGEVTSQRSASTLSASVAQSTATSDASLSTKKARAAVSAKARLLPPASSITNRTRLRHVTHLVAPFIDDIYTLLAVQDVCGYLPDDAWETLPQIPAVPLVVHPYLAPQLTTQKAAPAFRAKFHDLFRDAYARWDTVEGRADAAARAAALDAASPPGAHTSAMPAKAKAILVLRQVAASAGIPWMMQEASNAAADAIRDGATSEDDVSMNDKLPSASYRRAALVEGLRRVGLPLRSDSTLCAQFIQHGTVLAGASSDALASDATAIAHIVDTMDEMSFLMNKTGFHGSQRAYNCFPDRYSSQAVYNESVRVLKVSSARAYVHSNGRARVPASLLADIDADYDKTHTLRAGWAGVSRSVECWSCGGHGHMSRDCYMRGSGGYRRRRW